MHDPQYKKLMKLFGITWGLLVIVMAVVAICAIYLLFKEPSKEIHNYVGERGEKGEQGVQGIPGIQGLPGLPGQSTTVERLVEKVVEKPVEGTPGKDGAPGATGRSPEIRKNEETGDVEWRLENDSFWQVILSKCDYSDCEGK